MKNKFEKYLFSVIMPTYNRADIIEESLNAVLKQSYRPIEVIVVDDGSSDNTHQVIKRWKRQHERNDIFRIIYCHQENAGPSAARNRGLNKSQGEYIQFLDSDDILHPQRLEKLAAVFKDPECDFIQTGFDGFCAICGETIEQHYGNPNEDQLILALKGRLWANTLRSAFRRSLAVATGLWKENMTCFEDYEYVVRALARSRKSMAIRDILASARRGGDVRVSDSLRTYEGRTFRIMCEAALCQRIRQRTDIPLWAKQEFASRLYGLGFRSNARGWSELGKRCGELAESIEVELDTLGKRRWLAYRLGKWGGLAYELLGRIKERLTQHVQGWHTKHNCKKNGKSTRLELNENK
ncbi:glycosyltransferase [Desulfococcaceae bacterium HSG7]|nr:glycosyltransferase [Desulfococcaceae bacterium HSG7]